MATAQVNIKVNADTAQAKANVQSFADKVNDLSQKWNRASEGFSKGLRAVEMMGEAFAKGGFSAAAFAKGLEGLPGAFGAVAKAANAAADAIDAYHDRQIAAMERKLLADVRVTDEKWWRENMRRIEAETQAMEELDAANRAAARSRMTIRVGGETIEGEDSSAARRRRAGNYWARQAEARARDRRGSPREEWTDTTPSQGWAPWTNMVGGYIDKQNQPTSWGSGLGGFLEGGLGAAGGAISGLADKARGAATEKQAGVSEKFLANLEDQTSKTGAAFSALSAGMAASVEAAITGSQSIGQAFKNAAAAALKATAVESTIKALYHTAAGVGSIALGPIGGVSAAAHFKAAGLYAATALAAGAASAGLGGGGGGGGYAGAGAGAGGGGYSRPSQGGGDGGSIINITIGHGFVGDEQKLGAEIHKAVASARRSGRARDSSVISHD